MKTKLFKAMSLLLVFAILVGFGNLPWAFSAFADEIATVAENAENADEADTSGLTVRDFATIALAGSVKWTLYTNGLLEFSGTGVIPSYAEGAAPWYQYRDSITEILVRKTITEIGSGAFYGCNEVTEITLPFVGKSRTTTTGIESVFGYIFGYYGIDDRGSSPTNVVGKAASALVCMPTVVEEDVYQNGKYYDKRRHSHGYRYRVVDMNAGVVDDNHYQISTKLESYNFGWPRCSFLDMDPLTWYRNHGEGLSYRRRATISREFSTAYLSPSGSNNGMFSCYDYLAYGYYWLQTYVLRVPTALKTVNITDATRISDGAFFRCSSITEIHLNTDITYIGAYAFYETSWYSRLKDEFVIVGDGVLIKYNGTKSGVILPDNVKIIGGPAFRNNTRVSDVVLHDGIRGINSRAFEGCSKLLAITIPKSVTSIGKEAIPDACTIRVHYPSAGYNYRSTNRIVISHTHSFTGEKETVAEATCIHEGTNKMYCTFAGCDEFKVETVPALGHSFTEYLPDNNATCAENGTETAKCDRCDATDTRVIEDSALGHHYSAEWTVDQEPTCTEPGSKSHHCTVCGDKANITSIPALGHSFTKYIPDNNATCIENGTETAKCDRCDATDTRVIENSTTEHNYSLEWTVDKKPTCTEPGSKSHHCIVCGDKADITEIPAEHTFGPWVVTVPPTSDTEGVRERTCSKCGEVEKRTIDPIAAMPQIIVDSTTTHVGDTVTVNVSVKNNPGIIAMLLQIDYDSSVLELQEANTKDFQDVSFGPIGNHPFTVSWEDAIHPNTTTDGSVVELIFKVKDEAAFGQTAITVTYDEENIFNSDFDNVFFEVIPGSVEVLKYRPGDINGDDSVNMKDYALFRQYLTGWNVDIELAVADINDDAIINMKDLALLRQWLTGWEVELK